MLAHLNVDHVKPICRGGSDTDDNKVLACEACNNYKGGFNCNSLKEAREYVSQRRDIAEAWFHKHVKLLD